MKYREMAGEKISVLGFGCMRFPTTSKMRKTLMPKNQQNA